MEEHTPSTTSPSRQASVSETLSLNGVKKSSLLTPSVQFFPECSTSSPSWLLPQMSTAVKMPAGCGLLRCLSVG